MWIARFGRHHPQIRLVLNTPPPPPTSPLSRTLREGGILVVTDHNRGRNMFLSVILISTAALVAVVTAGFQGASSSISDSTPPATVERTSSPSCCHRSPVAPEGPLDDDDLLREILLRLLPQPSSLPCAALVCKHWRRLVSDPGFTRRFRLHHHSNPPLLGLFHFDEDDNLFRTLGYRHGLALIYLPLRDQFLVWDPVSGDRHYLDVPPGFERKKSKIHGVVLRAAGDARHFQVLLVGNDEKQLRRVLACVYSSETGAWGNLVSTLLPPSPKGSWSRLSYLICMTLPGVLVGDSIYWSFFESSDGILKFDLGRQSLVVIPLPVDVFVKGYGNFTIMRAEDGGLGCLFLSGFSAQFWKRKIDCGGVASSWVLGRTMEMDKVLPMNSEGKRGPLKILGFAEDSNVAVVWTIDGLFMVQTESL
ncbi:hypothetical protein BRADI_3g02263v3 [Brachypodium distachyon]|uniref:F-box domain-containing protein n=1 Tax=Brachypodium distachyon TaxID=15368 RepID=A0A0Q3J3U4_BRADI|nr:hypothetical protein BRADI_3g02263v3 [Brachypodium distachyon]